MFPDLTLPPAQIIVDAINRANFPGTLPAALTVGDVVLADPAIYGGDAYNTKIPMGIAGASQPIFGTGTIDLYYNRVDVAKLLDTASAPLDGSAATTVADVLDQINSQYGLNLQAADIVDHDIDFSVSPPVGTLEITAANLIYVGFNVLQFAPLTLAQAVTSTQMDGLTPPA